MKVLVTGFDPFGGEKVNPAFEVVRRISDNIAGAEIVKLQVPTAFKLCIEKTIEKMKEIKPDVVLNIGQAGGRTCISVERVGINISDARIPDNLNQQPVDERIDENGKNAYFATIPIKAVVEGIRGRNIPASVSDSAGTYVCNHLMYGVLNYIDREKLNIRAGFIHIPFLFQQVIEKPNMAAMDLDTMVTAIETAIEIIIKTEKDTGRADGNIC